MAGRAGTAGPDPPPGRDGRLRGAAVSLPGVFGVYVHIPFCTRRCDYCAFATWTDRPHLIPEYLDACRRSLGVPPGAPVTPRAAAPVTPRAAAPVTPRAAAPATSVFVGGGTPSLVPADGLVMVLDAVERAPGAEVTVECNPETVTPALLATYRRGGVTRLSFGVQSMVPHVLAALGRDHDPAAVRRAIAAAEGAGFAGAWSADLIYGAVGESLRDWEATVREILAFQPAHLSAYALTVEPGTPLAAAPGRHPDDDDQADKYALADDLLGEAGLGWYEISNWAAPGAECRHNQLYWAQGDYLGVGCAAHSHEDGTRSWNVRTPERFIDLVAAGQPVVAGSERLDAGQRAQERLQLSLRTRVGVAAGAVEAGVVEAGLVTVAKGRAVLTRRGRLLANEVAMRLRVAEDLPAVRERSA